PHIFSLFPYTTLFRSRFCPVVSCPMKNNSFSADCLKRSLHRSIKNMSRFDLIPGVIRSSHRRPDAFGNKQYPIIRGKINFRQSRSEEHTSELQSRFDL